MTEKEIIKGCIKGDRRSQNALYKLYFPLLSSVALRYSNNRDDAISAMNYGFLKVLQNIDKYDEKHALATWIRRVVVNHFIDEYRKKEKYISNMHISDATEVPAPVSFNTADRDMDADELRGLLKQLPTITQKVFNLFAVDGYKHKEISTMLEISEGTSKWHVAEARKILKQKLEKKTEVIESTPLIADSK